MSGTRASNVPGTWVKTASFSGKKVANYVQFARRDAVISQCLNTIINNACKGGFTILDNNMDTPLFFRDPYTYQYLLALFEQMLIWLLTVGFVPIAIDADVTKWATDNGIIEKLFRELQKKINSEGESKKGKKRDREDDKEGDNKPSKKMRMEQNPLYEPDEKANKDKKKKNKNKNKNESEGPNYKNSQPWIDRQVYSHTNQPSRNKVLPITIPEYDTGDFDIYMDDDGQVQMTFTPDENMPETFKKKRFVVMVRNSLMGPSKHGVFRTGIDLLFHMCVIKEAVKADAVHAANANSREVIVGMNETTPLNPGDISDNQMWAASRNAHGKDGGALITIPPGTYHTQVLNGVMRLADRAINPGTDGHSSRYDDNTPGGFFNDDNEPWMGLQNVGNAVFMGLNQANQAQTRLDDALFVPSGANKVLSMHRAEVSTIHTEFEVNYRKEVSFRMGVPYHIIDTGTGQYKPLEEQTSTFESVISSARSMISDFFSFVYTEAFYKAQSNIVENVVTRLNAMSANMINALKKIQVSKVLMGDTKKRKKAADEGQQMQIILNDLNEEQEPKEEEKLLFELDEMGLHLLQRSATIRKMIGLVSCVMDRNNKPSVHFNLDILPSLTKIKQGVDIAAAMTIGETPNPAMMALPQRQFQALMNSGK